MKTLILLLLLSIPLSAFSQDELTHFKSLCQSRKDAKVKSIASFIDKEIYPLQIHYFDQNGFPEKIEIFSDGNKLYALIENISLSPKNMICFKQTFFDENANTSSIDSIPLATFIEFGYGDNATITVKYKFDSQNRIIEKIYTFENYNGNLIYTDKLFYDENNRVQTVKFFNEKNEYVETAYYTYDSKGLLTNIRYVYKTGADEYNDHFKYTFY